MVARSLDTIAKLASYDERERTDSFFVEGDRFVIAALTTRATVVELVLAKERRLTPTLAKLVARFHGPIRRPPMTAFESVSRSAEPSGVGAVVRRVDGDLPRNRNQRGPLLCFDGVRSLGNLGSAIRSAAAFDAGAVVFSIEGSIRSIRPLSAPRWERFSPFRSSEPTVEDSRPGRSECAHVSSGLPHAPIVTFVVCASRTPAC